MKYISSRDNSSFKRLRNLVDDARTRRAEQATIIDGDHLIQAALDAQWPISLLVCREDVKDSALVAGILRQIEITGLTVEILVMAPGLFNAISPVLAPTGLLAEISLPAEISVPTTEGDVLALAGVQDAGNLGSLLRTALAAGVRQVWLDSRCAQAWSPKALRAGMGAQFHLSIVEGCELAAHITEGPRQVLATSLADDSVSLFGLDLNRPNLWVFGSEGQGVPIELQALADRRVRIPMPGQIESLNVGAAAAVCLFEQLRQRLVV